MGQAKSKWLADQAAANPESPAEYCVQTPEEFADMVVRVRKGLGWKQFTLADEAGVNERTIQRLEQGERVNNETFRKVAKALRLPENALAEPDSSPENGRLSELYWPVAQATSGLHGTGLGFGQFLRALPEETLQAATLDLTLLFLITAHAMLIVDGDPNAGIEEERFNDQSLRSIRILLIVEHFRRAGFLRARYPRDPFTEVPEIAWWTGHLYVKILYSLPPEHSRTFQDLLLQTGDVGILTGHIITLSAAEQEQFLERVEKIDSHLPEYLEFIEEEYGDSQKLAWSEAGAANQDR
jgi:transcriptional regulator with XRE-family HTH domain